MGKQDTLNGAPLSPAFFDRNPVTVARELLGTLLVRSDPQHGVLAVTRVVETEAYDCPRDPSCRALERLPGAREMLAGGPGRYYLHRSYRFELLNVVCMPPGHEAAILVRAVEPLQGLEWLRRQRGQAKSFDLTNGPAKLTQALGIDARFAGRAVDDEELFFAEGEPVPDEEVRVTGRIGLTVGGELPWRFLVAGNRWVSRGKPNDF